MLKELGFIKTAVDERVIKDTPTRKGWSPETSVSVLKNAPDKTTGIRLDKSWGGSSKNLSGSLGFAGTTYVKPSTKTVKGDLYTKADLTYKPNIKNLPSIYGEATLGLYGGTGEKPTIRSGGAVGIKKKFKMDNKSSITPYAKYKFYEGKHKGGAEIGVNYNF